jgi:glutamine cyclotransferase
MNGNSENLISKTNDSKFSLYFQPYSNINTNSTMNKFLSLIIILAFTACVNNPLSTSSTTANNDLTISTERHDTYYSLLTSNVDSTQQNVDVFIHDSLFYKGKALKEITIDQQNLRLGLNPIKVIIHENKNPQKQTDTLFSSIYFSYNIGYQVVAKYTHDKENFTEGLFIDGKTMYESTGLEGKSKIVKYHFDEKDMTTIATAKNDPSIFGEGLASVNGSMFQLTWRNHVAYQFDKQTMKLQKQFQYPNEGWGLCTDGDYLIASDGSAYLYFIKPADFSILNKLEVRDENGSVKNINELELVGNIIVANIWQTNTVIFIAKQNGNVIGQVDLSELTKEEKLQDAHADVLNGIAYDSTNQTFIITGKLWNHFYRIKLDAEYDKLILRSNALH